MSRLVRKQVYITEEQDLLVKRVARRERCTEAEIIRSALSKALGPKKAARSRDGRDPIWDIVGLGRTDDGDVSHNVDHYLYGVARR